MKNSRSGILSEKVTFKADDALNPIAQIAKF